MELVNGRVYSTGKQTFVLNVHADNSSLTQTLYVIRRMGRKVIKPTSPGDLAGYAQRAGGVWYSMYIGHPEHSKQRIVMHPYIEFDEEILPKLEEIAPSMWRRHKTLSSSPLLRSLGPVGAGVGERKDFRSWSSRNCST